MRGSVWAGHGLVLSVISLELSQRILTEAKPAKQVKNLLWVEACEAGEKHRAWGVSPRKENRKSIEPAQRAKASLVVTLSPVSRGSPPIFHRLAWGLRPRLYAFRLLRRLAYGMLGLNKVTLHIFL